ncbi:sugar ABC transporter substrate-binding protein [Diplocloster modestus]|uniref:Sugar ABC transporter substrate-binding protein n=1 Tax=Diplocloster modestus TaxID=2850322 RepID=A0ABS6KBM1_9FIRM|nr:sugar ABC transporter substrate-binding protein [Diplocloster modestus]MBU9727903.1 sugar ABC transporter substrate-binding protein [Diplocloster modestus]
MKRKLLSILLAVTLVAGMMTGCGAKEEAPAAAPSAEPAETAAPEATPDAAPTESPAANAAQTGTAGASGLKIGVCYCMLSAPAVKVFAQGIQEKAKELGVELIELDGGFDASKQTDQINSLVSQKVDGIVLNPVDGTSIIPAVKAAKEAGIPVVMGAMDIDESGREYVVSFVGADDKDVGAAAGKKMLETLGEKGGKVAIVEGTAGTSAATLRTEGFEEAIKGSSIEVVTKLSADFDKAKAMSITEDILTKYPDLSGIWVHDDTMCVGVAQAMKSMGYTGEDLKVVSYNGSKNGADMVKSGEIVATSVQPLVDEGRTSIEVLVKAISGETVETWYKDKIDMLDASNVDSYDPALLW